jgi:hypothetical protein
VPPDAFGQGANWLASTIVGKSPFIRFVDIDLSFFLKNSLILFLVTEAKERIMLNKE